MPEGVTDYGDIFELRGHRYHRAMQACPRARDDEFALAVDWAEIRDGQVVCDIPSGPGYLRHYLGAGIDLVHIEPSAVFARLCRAESDRPVVLGTLLELPLQTGIVDRVVSLAALHHVADKGRFFAEAFRVLAPGGRLCIADAARNSPTDAFLNGFVHAHNSMGHEGCFIGDETTAEIEAVGFRVERVADVEVPWHFRSPNEMVAFVGELFGLDRASPAQVLGGIERYLGWRVEDGGCRMRWELRFVRATKPRT